MIDFTAQANGFLQLNDYFVFLNYGNILNLILLLSLNAEIIL